MKKKYTVVLPIDVDGRIYQHGSTVELDEATAKLYSHALIAQEETTSGSHS
jgi:hypothetical protein